jgi:hypothetical protein
VKTPKTTAVGVALASAAIALAPVAGAGMLIGNYEVETTRDPGHSWLDGGDWAAHAAYADGMVDQAANFAASHL